MIFSTLNFSFPLDGEIVSALLYLKNQNRGRDLLGPSLLNPEPLLRLLSEKNDGREKLWNLQTSIEETNNQTNPKDLLENSSFTEFISKFSQEALQATQDNTLSLPRSKL